jgi:5-methylcytosine-specific restriction endonuclease McrA
VAYKGSTPKELGTAKWKNTRRYIRSRDGDRCRICEASGAIQRMYTHHITPRTQGGTDDVKNLMLVCQSCHMKLEREAQKPPPPKSVAPWLSGDNQIGGRRPQSRDWGGGCIPNPAAERSPF